MMKHNENKTSGLTLLTDIALKLTSNWPDENFQSILWVSAKGQLYHFTRQAWPKAIAVQSKADLEKTIAEVDVLVVSNAPARPHLLLHDRVVEFFSAQPEVGAATGRLLGALRQDTRRSEPGYPHQYKVSSYPDLAPAYIAASIVEMGAWTPGHHMELQSIAENLPILVSPSLTPAVLERLHEISAGEIAEGSSLSDIVHQVVEALHLKLVYTPDFSFFYQPGSRKLLEPHAKSAAKNLKAAPDALAGVAKGPVKIHGASKSVHGDGWTETSWQLKLLLSPQVSRLTMSFYLPEGEAKRILKISCMRDAFEMSHRFLHIEPGQLSTVEFDTLTLQGFAGVAEHNADGTMILDFVGVCDQHHFAAEDKRHLSCILAEIKAHD